MMLPVGLMNQEEKLRLPVKLEDGLLLRWGVPADAQELGTFNIKVHSENPSEPQNWLADWTADLMSGKHPTTQASDFTVVVDQKAGNKIVSSLNLISQTWTYADIPFGVGRIELVGTDPQYRRRGLIRRQMNAVHQKSAARGELLQAITGIPWYYRQFGYEMTVNLSGSRELFWIRPANDKPVKEEIYQMRPAERSDIPKLQTLYPLHCADSLLVAQRSKNIWEYELFVATRETAGARTLHMIEDGSGSVVAYAQIFPYGTAFRVREVAVIQGHSWRAVALFLIRELKKRARELNQERDKSITHIVFNLGVAHPLYDALGSQLEKQQKPYAWYIRVPDLIAFLNVISPVLERRLSQSVMAGHTGALRLNLYRNTLSLLFENGKIRKIETYEPDRFFDADAFFPDLSFLNLLFCHRSFAELDAAFVDCFAEKLEAAVLLDCLFPRQPSDINPIS
jgi:predicted acetyltransferase